MIRHIYEDVNGKFVFVFSYVDWKFKYGKHTVV